MNKKKIHYLFILCIFFSIFILQEPNVDFFCPSFTTTNESRPLQKEEIRKKHLNLQDLALKEKTKISSNSFLLKEIQDSYAVYGNRFVLASFLILLLSLFYFYSLQRVREKKRREMRTWQEIEYIHLEDGKKKIIF